MKHVISRLRSLFLLTSAFLFQAIAFAQDSGAVKTTQINTNQTTTETTWYGQPWVWVIGAVVVVLIIIALMRSNSTSTSSDKVTVTKTVERDTDS